MVDFLPDTEQQQILDSVVEFLAREAPVSRLRKPHDGPAHRDAHLWPQLIELGWFGLGLPEELGGVGLSIAEEMLLFREAGRHLLSPALLGTVLAAHLATAANQRELAGRITSGAVRVGLASAVGPVTLGPSATGNFHCCDAVDAQLLLVWNTTGVAMLDRDAFDALERIPALDESIALERSVLRGVTPVAWLPAGESSLQDHATVLNAALLMGAALGAQELAVGYAKFREQFGQPIGAFQAIKHACANMAMRSEAASALTTFAALAVREQRGDAAFQAAAAKIIAVDAAVENGAGAVRIHGGMGFTAECDAHHFLKRAHILDQIGGNQRAQQTHLLRQPPPSCYLDHPTR